MARQTKKQKYLEKLRYHLNPALVLSVKNNDVERVKLLLIMGADINEKTHSTYPLHEACERGCLEMVQTLVDRGANVNIPRSHWQVDSTPLSIACSHGHFEVVRLLLEAGADVNASGGWGTSLNRACVFGHAKIVQVLLDAGADIEARDNDGATSLHKACRHLEPGIVKLLLERGASVTGRDNDGCTPLDRLPAPEQDEPRREEIIELFREYAPEMVMEKWCRGNQNPGVR